jgi:ADP-heptose:LPS heptosyltransferase
MNGASPVNERMSILVIKLSALGDFIQALGVMRAIRAYHKDAHITLMTTAPFETLARECGYIDDVLVDTRPRFYDVKSIAALRAALLAGGFSRVYDLQNNDRTALYLRLLPKNKRPDWYGFTKGASHRVICTDPKARPALQRHRDILAKAGITGIERDDLSWMKADITRFGLADRYALLVPGCAPRHPEKRWPAEYYGALAGQLHEHGVQPVLIGTADEADVMDRIAQAHSFCINLCGQTDFHDIAGLAGSACVAIGNDTGPMHIIAATGCAALTLFSGKTDPARHAPQGAAASTLQKHALATLSPALVTKAALRAMNQDS